MSLRLAERAMKAQSAKTISRATISRIAHNLKLDNSPQISRHVFTDDEILNRVFYSDIIARRIPRHLVWGDETTFTINWNHVPKEWTREGKHEVKPLHLNRRKLHVFAAVSMSGKTELFFLENKKKWNAQT